MEFDLTRLGSGSRSSNGWDLIYEFPVVASKGRSGTYRTVALGDSLVMSFQLRNRTGLDRPLTTELIRSRDGHVVGLANGLTLKLDYAPPPPDPAVRVVNQPDAPNWTGVATKKGIARFEPSGPEKTLRPTELSSPTKLDLNDLFEINKPGRYRLKIDLGPDPKPNEAWDRYFDFSIVPKDDAAKL